MPKINMEAILKEKDIELMALNGLIDKLGKTRKPVGIVCNSDDPICVKYANLKKKAFESYGFHVDLLETAKGTKYEYSITNRLMVQLPHPNADEEISYIAYPTSDIDCLMNTSLARVIDSNGNDGAMLPATVKAVFEILKHEGRIKKGNRAVIIGKSKLVGKPLANVLMNNGITVAIFGRDEVDPVEVVLRGLYPEILVLATNSPKIISASQLKYLSNTLVVDVGSCLDEEGKYCGNYNPNTYESDDSFPDYTPVPGGVGPMTIRCLIENHILSHF